MMRARGSAAWTSRRRANVPSTLPSSIRISSYGEPMRSRTPVNSSCRGQTFASSSRSGMTTDRSGSAAPRLTRLLPASRPSLQQPPTGGKGQDQAGHPQGDLATSRLHELLGGLAIPDGEEAERQVARATGQPDGHHELKRAD